MPEEVKSTIELEIKEALDIDETDILSELRRHSAKYFWYGVLWAKASKTKRQQRLRVKELEARLTNQLRQEIALEDSKTRVTEAIKNDYLYNHPEYLEASNLLIKHEYMEEVLDVARDGMKQRGLALQELARQNREENFYGDEFKAMKKEYSERVEEIPKKRYRRTKAELMAAKQQEITEVVNYKEDKE